MLNPFNLQKIYGMDINSMEYQIKSKLTAYIKSVGIIHYNETQFDCPACHNHQATIKPGGIYWSCNGCQNGGTIIELCAICENLYPEEVAIKALCRRFGIKNIELKTVSSNELLSMQFEPTRPVISRLMPRGTYIFAGASKIGKSWMVLWFANQISLGKPIWEFETTKGEVLYISLEDTPKRLQQRLNDISAEEVGTIYFSTQAEVLGNGLEEQLTNFIKQHPKVSLIIIDTLQKIRELGADKYGYASDYGVIGRIKKIADDKNIAILIVHHTRKENDEDSFNTISGTTGLLGCADGAFILKKQSRMQKTASFEATGRDIPDIKLNLEFDSETRLWNMLSQSDEDVVTADDSVLMAISKLVKEESPTWKGTSTELLTALFEIDNTIDAKPNILAGKLNSNADLLLTKYNISYMPKRENNTKYIILTWSPCDMCDNSDFTEIGDTPQNIEQIEQSDSDTPSTRTLKRPISRKSDN